jgi:hypothetical protein
MGFGREEVSSAIRVPRPPANMTAFITTFKRLKPGYKKKGLFDPIDDIIWYIAIN